MANEVLAPIEGIPEMITGIGLGIAETNRQLVNASVNGTLKLAKAGGLLAKELGLRPSDVMALIGAQIPQTQVIGAAEIHVRGDVSRSNRFGVEGGASLSFTPYFALNVAASFGTVSNQAWGVDVRASLAVIPRDNDKLVEDLIGRFQKREVEDPKFLQEALGDSYGLIKEILGKDGTLLNPDTPEPAPEDDQ